MYKQSYHYHYLLPLILGDGRGGGEADQITISDSTYTSRIIVPVAWLKKMVRGEGATLYCKDLAGAGGRGLRLEMLGIYLDKKKLLAVLGLCRTTHAQIILNSLVCFVNLIGHFGGCVQGRQTLAPSGETGVWSMT